MGEDLNIYTIDSSANLDRFESELFPINVLRLFIIIIISLGVGVVYLSPYIYCSSILYIHLKHFK